MSGGRTNDCESVGSDAVKNILFEAFSQYDKDGSGEIDYDEMQRLLRDLNWPCDQIETNRMLSALDGDNNGSISFEEFMRWYDTIDDVYGINCSSCPHKRSI